MKYCYRCKTEKPYTDFNKNRHTADGFKWECRDCQKIVRLEWIARNPDYFKKYYKTDKGKLVILNHNYRYNKNNQKENAARSRIAEALVKGTIIRPEYCEIFGKGCTAPKKIEAHHYAGYDGDNWSKVIWLCKRHHIDEHMKLKQIALKGE